MDDKEIKHCNFVLDMMPEYFHTWTGLEYLLKIPEHTCSEDSVVELWSDSEHGDPGHTYKVCDFCIFQVILYATYMTNEDGHDGVCGQDDGEIPPAPA